VNLSLQLSFSDWLAFFQHFLSLSLLAVGGAVITAPDMHRFLVAENQWLTEQQFSSSIALAQSAPGPNVLFVGLMGWNVGLNAGAGLGGGWITVALSALGLVAPSSTTGPARPLRSRQKSARMTVLKSYGL
jgi:chromate transporter